MEPICQTCLRRIDVTDPDACLKPNGTVCLLIREKGRLGAALRNLVNVVQKTPEAMLAYIEAEYVLRDIFPPPTKPLVETVTETANGDVPCPLCNKPGVLTHHGTYRLHYPSNTDVRPCRASLQTPKKIGQ